LFTSTSAKKLNARRRSRKEEVRVDINHGYRITEFFSVFSTLSQFVICKECKEQVKFCELRATWDLKLA